MRNKVIYRHLKPNGEVFYIGIGKKSRAYSKKDRNKHWHNIVNKYGYEVQILKEGLNWEEACELETLLINYYGRRDLGTGTLVNLTDGGDGAVNLSKESRKKTSDALKGKPSHRKGKKLSEEHKAKLSKAHTGKKHSEETKAKMSKPKRGKKVIDTETGVIFDSIKSAALENNIKESTLSSWLIDTYKNKSNLEYYGI